MYSGTAGDQAPDFDVRVERTGADTATVAPVGDLDRANAPELADALAELGRTRDLRVTVDLTGVPFMDSGGLRVLLDARHLFPEGFVVVATGRARELLDLTGCHRFLEIR